MGGKRLSSAYPLPQVLLHASLLRKKQSTNRIFVLTSSWQRNICLNISFRPRQFKREGKKQNKKNRAHKKPGETQERDVCTFFQSVTFRIQSPPSKASVFLCPLLCNKLEKEEEGQGSDFENPEFQVGLLFNVFCGFDWSGGYGFWLNVLLWKIF